MRNNADLKKTIYHFFHPFTSYENPTQKMRVIEGILALALGYFTTSLALSKNIANPLVRSHPYAAGIAIFYTITALFKLRMDKNVKQPPKILGTQKPLRGKPSSQKNTGSHKSKHSSTGKGGETSSHKSTSSTTSQQKEVKDWKKVFESFFDHFDWIHPFSNGGAHVTQNLDNFEGLRLNNETTFVLKAHVSLLVIIQKVISSKKPFSADLLSKIHAEVQQNKELCNSLLDILSVYHPYTVTREEFRKYFSYYGPTISELTFALFLFGYISTDKDLSTLPNIKGCKNSLTVFTKQHVDLIPTHDFAILGEDDYGFERTELPQLKNHGEYIELKKPFSHFDCKVIEGTDSLEDHRYKYCNLKQGLVDEEVDIPTELNMTYVPIQPWQSSLNTIPLHFGLDAQNPNTPPQGVKDLLPEITMTTTFSGDELAQNLHDLLKNKVIINVSQLIPNFHTQPALLKLELLYQEFSQQPGLNQLLLKLISKFHPFALSEKEFKTACTIVNSDSTIKITKDGFSYALLLLGYFKRNRKWNSIANIKGCLNSKTHFTNQPVDFVPTSKFVVLTGDSHGFEESELDALKKQGHYIHSKTPFNSLDAKVINGDISIADYKNI